MKILFVENRYKTSLWKLIAFRLMEKGHECAFVVQNPLFQVKGFKNYLLTSSSCANMKETLPLRFEKVLSSDRNFNFYGCKDFSYYHDYYVQIEEVFKEFQPKVVFGESTLFHELLCVEVSKARGVLFLHPSTSRYPKGRFSFYKYDSLDPFRGSQDEIDQEDATSLIQGIVQGQVFPDYMNGVWGEVKVKQFLKKAALWLRLAVYLMSYLLGERYNTPSPLRRLRLEGQRLITTIRLKRISRLFSSQVDSFSSKFVILYPMQLQPEANIDVWGREYRNQEVVIRGIVEQLKDDEILVIKPNPKFKYEFESSLLGYVKDSSKVVVMPINSRMSEIIPVVDLVVTVSGTIAIEAPFYGIPVVSFVNSYMLKNSYVYYAPDIIALRDIIDVVRDSPFKCSDNAKVEFVKYLNRISYCGRIGDPGINSMIKSKENLQLLESAFCDVLDNLGSDCD